MGAVLRAGSRVSGLLSGVWGGVSTASSGFRWPRFLWAPSARSGGKPGERAGGDGPTHGSAGAAVSVTLARSAAVRSPGRAWRSRSPCKLKFPEPREMVEELRRFGQSPRAELSVLMRLEH